MRRHPPEVDLVGRRTRQPGVQALAVVPFDKERQFPPDMSPAQESTAAIRAVPSTGHSTFSHCTRCATKSGNFFTGSGVRTSAAGPSSSSRIIQDATFASVTRNRSAVCAADRP